MRLLVAAATALVLLLAVAGCGDDDESPDTQVLPAAGPLTPPSGTPGVPAGSRYDLNGNEYLKLDPKQAEAVARDFVGDRPEDCEGADPGQVAAYATVSVGTDFPLTEPIVEVLTEGCAADLQS